MTDERSLFPHLRDEDAVLLHKVDRTAADKRGIIRAVHDIENCRLCALLDVAEQANKAMNVWFGGGDCDADFLCIQKHLTRAVDV